MAMAAATPLLPSIQGNDTQVRRTGISEAVFGGKNNGVVWIKGFLFGTLLGLVSFALPLFVILATPKLAPLLQLPEPHAFNITVVDSETGRGVPMVELRDTINQRWVTDNMGRAFIRDPALFGQKVWFFVSSDGYSYPADGFGNRGKALSVITGSNAVLTIYRNQYAQRLYRITGVGMCDTPDLCPISHPFINARVTGQDGAIPVFHDDKLFFFWGDTGDIQYPLGNFEGTAAIVTTNDPDVGLNISYFQDPSGFVKKIAPFTPTNAATWLQTLVEIPSDPKPIIAAHYLKIYGGWIGAKTGTAFWDDANSVFIDHSTFPLSTELSVAWSGQAFIDGDYVFVMNPFPQTRIRILNNSGCSTPTDCYANMTLYEGYSPLVEGTNLNNTVVDRYPNGTIKYAWKMNTPPLQGIYLEKAIDNGLLARNESNVALYDGNDRLTAMSGSTFFNPHISRHVMLCQCTANDSALAGEVYYAESESPLGPWRKAIKVASHASDTVGVYGVQQYERWDVDQGRQVYFGLTYSAAFAEDKCKKEYPTQKYDYNNIIYKLDIDQVHAKYIE